MLTLNNGTRVLRGFILPTGEEFVAVSLDRIVSDWVLDPVLINLDPAALSLALAASDSNVVPTVNPAVNDNVPADEPVISTIPCHHRLYKVLYIFQTVRLHFVAHLACLLTSSSPLWLPIQTRRLANSSYCWRMFRILCLHMLLIGFFPL